MPTQRRGMVVVVLISLLVGLGALAAMALRPLGASDAGTAAREYETRGSSGSRATVLEDRPWGDGRHVLLRTTNGSAVSMTLSFVRDTGRGWRVVKRATQRSEPSDIVVGSLLLAESEGGPGQPPWTAAFGELSDDRIARVQIVWSDGQTTTTERTDDAFLAVRRGIHRATEAHFHDAGGAEVARVPVGDPSARP